MEPEKKKEKLPSITDEEGEQFYNAWIAEKMDMASKEDDGVIDPEKMNAAWFSRPSNVRSAINRHKNKIALTNELDAGAASHLAEITQ